MAQVTYMLDACALIAYFRGEEGAEVNTREGRQTVSAVPPEHLEDPTGIGDAFRGGFLKGYAHGLDLERCAEMGALAATYCLEAEGPQSHRFDLKTFLARFRQHFDDHGELDRLMDPA